MLVLGLILVVLAALALIAALAGGSSQQVDFDFGPIGLEMTPTAVFLLGAATVVIFAIGLELTRTGIRHANKRRQDSKELTRLSAKLEAHEANQSDRKTDTATEADTDTTADTQTDTSTHPKPDSTPGHRA